MKQSTRVALVSSALVLAAWFATSPAQTGDDQTTTAATPVSSPVPSSSPSAAPNAFPWPTQFTRDGSAFTVYPPQLDSWQGERLEARAAVAVQPAAAQRPVFGMVWLSARTAVESASGTVTMT